MADAWYAFVRWLVRTFYLKTHGGYRVVDAHHVPAKGPLIIACVHMSDLDPPAAACALKRPLHPMAKEELFHGVFGLLVRSLGAFPVRRGEIDPEAIRKAVTKLEAGDSLLIFPEGTRNDGEYMLPLNRGIALLAKRTNAAVVPVGLVGTNIVMPKGKSRKPEKHLITVAYGKPFTYEEVATGKNERENREIFTQELERRILALCNEHGNPIKSASCIESSPKKADPAPGIAG